MSDYNSYNIDTVYVTNKNQQLLAVFNKDDEDTLINPGITEIQNQEATFTFSIPLKSKKWKQIFDPENLYIVDNKIFSANFEGSFIETISEDDEQLIEVQAYEIEKLLSRKYVRAWNSETGFEKIDTFMCVILSNGNLPLKNNGTIVNTKYDKGTSGYVLDALLYGTGWKTGICDVEGTFDFETDQVDIYNNILKVQEIWGGILVFDSINKTVSHRNEVTWLPYNGYEVKYQKNMQSFEKQYNNRIITKLCPLGEGGLNIKSVNGGSEWLTNFTYTDTELEGIENNSDITDPEQLLRWGKRKLQELCRPRKQLTITTVLLYQLEGFKNERVGLNDIIDVVNYADIEDQTAQLRVVNFTHNLWDLSDATIELSDITLDSTDIFKKNIEATEQVNSGTLNTNQVVSFFRNSETVENTFRKIDGSMAKLEINSDTIRATVKNGGQNLLTNTTDKSWKEVSVDNHFGSSFRDIKITDLGLTAGDNVTYSFRIKTNTGKKIRARLEFYNSNNDRNSVYSDEFAQNEEKDLYVTGTIPKNYNYINLLIDANLTQTTDTTTTIENIKAEKLEKGSIATAWTPSINDYSTSTEVKQTAEGVSAEVVKNQLVNYTKTEDMNNAIDNAKDDAIKSANKNTTTELTNYYTKSESDSKFTITEDGINAIVGKKIDTAQTTANNAQSAANTAQATANNAQSAADTAQATANTAKTAANTAQKAADNAQEELSKFKTTVANTYTTKTDFKQANDSITSRVNATLGIDLESEGTGQIKFDNIKTSEPLLLKVHPTSTAEPVQTLYLSDNTIINDNLYLHEREIYFEKKNSQGNYEKVAEYNIPDDLYFIDKSTYDEFVLDYENNKCYINKRTTFNTSTGKASKANSTSIKNYDYPSIYLPEGDYRIRMPAFTTEYIYCKLITSTPYTRQLATKVEMNNEIKQTSQSLEVNIRKKINDEDLTSVSLIAKINADDTSKVGIKADKLELEGVTTINGGFSIDKKGNATIANNAVKINEQGIQMSNGTSIVGGKGMLTQFLYSNSGKCGFTRGVNVKYRNAVYLSVYVPSNFIVTNGNLIIIHNPAHAYIYDNNIEDIALHDCYVRNAKLYRSVYKARSDDGDFIVESAPYSPGELISNLGSDNGKTFSNASTETISISIDKSHFRQGIQHFYIVDYTDAIPLDMVDAFQMSGQITMELFLTGYVSS